MVVSRECWAEEPSKASQTTSRALRTPLGVFFSPHAAASTPDRGCPPLCFPAHRLLQCVKMCESRAWFCWQSDIGLLRVSFFPGDRRSRIMSSVSVGFRWLECVWFVPTLDAFLVTIALELPVSFTLSFHLCFYLVFFGALLWAWPVLGRRKRIEEQCACQPADDLSCEQVL